jgi:integrase
MTTTKAKRGQEFPKQVTVRGIPGITATIYRQERTKPDKDGKLQKYTSFLVGYVLLGKRKLEAYSDLSEAEEAAAAAIKRIADGQQGILELSNRERDAYMRSKELLAPVNVDLETACRECAETRAILNGAGTPVEAARFFMKHHAKELPRITVPAAVEECLARCRADHKSKARMRQLEHYLKNKFAADMNIQVSELSPGLVSRYLTSMVASEGTKKNARDLIGYFGRWLVLQGYLARGTDLLEGVQNYSARGEIQIFTAAEIAKLIEHADDRLLPYIVIGAFAGLRQAEIMRLDWSEIDLADGFIEVKAEKSKTDTRRLVPIASNLSTWLKDCRKKSGSVCPIGNVVNALMKLVATINKAMPENTPDKDRMVWKKNALRHSCISYRVAQCADVARVADESGNSPAIIRSNYLRRVKPDRAAEWFNVMPAGAVPAGKVAQLKV